MQNSQAFTGSADKDKADISAFNLKKLPKIGVSQAQGFPVEKTNQTIQRESKHLEQNEDSYGLKSLTNANGGVNKNKITNSVCKSRNPQQASFKAKTESYRTIGNITKKPEKQEITTNESDKGPRCSNMQAANRLLQEKIVGPTIVRSSSLQSKRNSIQIIGLEDSSSNTGAGAESQDIVLKQTRNGSSLKHFINKYVLCQGSKNKYHMIDPNLKVEGIMTNDPQHQMFLSQDKTVAHPISGASDLQPPIDEVNRGSIQEIKNTTSCLPIRQFTHFLKKRNSTQGRRKPNDFFRREDSVDSGEKLSTKHNFVQSLTHIDSGKKCTEKVDDPYQTGYKVAQKVSQDNTQIIGSTPVISAIQNTRSLPLLKKSQSGNYLPSIFSKQQSSGAIAVTQFQSNESSGIKNQKIAEPCQDPATPAPLQPFEGSQTKIPLYDHSSDKKQITRCLPTDGSDLPSTKQPYVAPSTTTASSTLPQKLNDNKATTSHLQIPPNTHQASTSSISDSSTTGNHQQIPTKLPPISSTQPAVAATQHFESQYRTTDRNGKQQDMPDSNQSSLINAQIPQKQTEKIQQASPSASVKSSQNENRNVESTKQGSLNAPVTDKSNSVAQEEEHKKSEVFGKLLPQKPIKSKRIMSSQRQRATDHCKEVLNGLDKSNLVKQSGVLGEQDNELEQDLDKIDCVTDQPSQATMVDISLSKNKWTKKNDAKGDLLFQKRQSEDVCNQVIDTVSILDKSAPTLQISASESHHNNLDKQSGLSTPQAVHDHEERSFQGIEQLINMNIKKIASMFDDMNLNNNHSQTDLSQLHRANKQFLLTTSGNQHSHQKSISDLDIGDIQKGIELQTKNEQQLEAQSFIKNHFDQMIDQTVEQILPVAENQFSQTLNLGETEPEIPLILLGATQAQDQSTNPCMPMFTPQHLTELQNRINITIENIKQIRMRQQLQSQDKIQSSRDSQKANTENIKKINEASEPGAQAHSSSSGMANSVMQAEIMDEVKKLIHIQNELLRYTIVSEHSLLNNDASSLQSSPSNGQYKQSLISQPQKQLIDISIGSTSQNQKISHLQNKSSNSNSPHINKNLSIKNESKCSPGSQKQILKITEKQSHHLNSSQPKHHSKSSSTNSPQVESTSLVIQEKLGSSAPQLWDEDHQDGSVAVKFAQSGHSHSESSEREGHARSDARDDELSEEHPESDQRVPLDTKDGDLEKECKEREEEIKLLEEKDQVLKKEIEKIDNAQQQREKATSIIKTLIKLKESQHQSCNASIGRQNFTKMKIIQYLQTNLELNELNIIKNYSAKRRIFCATQYYNGITELIHDRFGEPGQSISEDQFNLIYSILAYFCQSQKNQHHNLLLNILSYLPLEVLVMKVSLLNRKLYIVSGDMRLLQNYWNKNNAYLLDGAEEEEETPSQGEDGKHPEDGQQVMEGDEHPNAENEKGDRNSQLSSSKKHTTDGKKSALLNLQMIEEELSDDDVQSNSVTASQKHRQIQENEENDTDPPAFAQVTCYNDDILSQSKVSTANFHFEQEIPASNDYNMYGGLQQFDVFSFGGEKQATRVGKSISSVESMTPNEVDYCDISSIKDHMHLLHNSIKSSQAAQNKRKQRTDMAAYLDDGVPESLTFSLGNRVKGGCGGHQQQMAKQWRKRKELISESEDDESSQGGNGGQRISVGRSAGGLQSQHHLSNSKGARSGTRHQTGGSTIHKQSLQHLQQRDNILIAESINPYQDQKFRSNSNRNDDFLDSSDLNQITIKADSSQGNQSDDRIYAFDSSPNLLTSNFKQLKKRNIAPQDKKDRIGSLQAPPNLASKVDGSSTIHIIPLKKQNKVQQTSRITSQAFSKGINYLHGSVEGTTVIYKDRKNRLDLRNFSCSTQGEKKRISQQINKSIRKVHDERLKQKQDMHIVHGEGSHLQSSIINEVVKQNTISVMQQTMSNVLKLPDDKLFTSSLQGPEHNDSINKNTLIKVSGAATSGSAADNMIIIEKGFDNTPKPMKNFNPAAKASPMDSVTPSSQPVIGTSPHKSSSRASLQSSKQKEKLSINSNHQSLSQQSLSAAVALESTQTKEVADTQSSPSKEFLILGAGGSFSNNTKGGDLNFKKKDSLFPKDANKQLLFEQVSNEREESNQKIGMRQSFKKDQ